VVFRLPSRRCSGRNGQNQDAPKWMIETLSVEGEGAFNSTLRKNKMPDGNETTPAFYSGVS
jgi:hypothetical protein